MPTVSDSQRHQLHNAFEDLMGQEHADVLFDLLPPSGWADVARTRDLDALEQRMNLRFERLDAKFDGKLDALEARVEAKFERALREQYNRFLLTMIGVVGLITAVQTVIDRALG